LHEQHADDALAFADGREHGGGGMTLGGVGRQQFRALGDDALDQGVGRLGLRGRRNFNALPFDRGDIEQGKNLVFLRRI
jgi:hypothetical protein